MPMTLTQLIATLQRVPGGDLPAALIAPDGTAYEIGKIISQTTVNDDNTTSLTTEVHLVNRQAEAAAAANSPAPPIDGPSA
jgi:hypothetical protein